MEATINDFKVMPTNYINILLGMSNETKLHIIRLLTDRLLKSEVVIDDNREYTKKMLKKHAGTWVGDENANDIIACIRENYSSRTPLDF